MAAPLPYSTHEGALSQWTWLHGISGFLGFFAQLGTLLWGSPIWDSVLSAEMVCPHGWFGVPANMVALGYQEEMDKGDSDKHFSESYLPKHQSRCHGQTLYMCRSVCTRVCARVWTCTHIIVGGATHWESPKKQLAWPKDWRSANFYNHCQITLPKGCGS